MYLEIYLFSYENMLVVQVKRNADQAKAFNKATSII